MFGTEEENVVRHFYQTIYKNAMVKLIEPLTDSHYLAGLYTEKRQGLQDNRTGKIHLGSSTVCN